MTYDDTARKVGIKAIGTVESNLDYSSVNTSDPITVGIMQWYGTRAAALLDQIRSSNAASWTGVPDSLTSDLDSHAATSSFWNTRYLNGSEIAGLKPVLGNNKTIQINLAFTDLDSYTAVATSNGMDKDNNTQAVLFFDNMYNQSPREALRVLAVAGPASNLDRLYDVCLNNAVLGRYRNRYATAKSIIAAMDSSGVDNGNTAPSDTNDGGNPTGGTIAPSGTIKNISISGNNLLVKFNDNHTLFCVPTGNGWFQPQKDSTQGSGNNVAPTPNPDAPNANGSLNDKQQALMAWMQSHLLKYNYSQGAGRLSPDTSGYTDCSGLVRYCMMQTIGVDPGTWTGDQMLHGTLIASGSGATLDTSQAAVGDLIIIDWTAAGGNSGQHVVMYAGGTLLYSHGGPGKGPVERQLPGYLSGTYKWWLRRYF